MRIAVIGVGGVGGYFGGRLAQAGEDVVFIARGEHLRALREHGLRVESIAGDFHLPQVQATDDAVAAGHAELIIVAVKAWQLPDAGPSISAMTGPRTVILPLQNGVEASAQLATIVAKRHVLGGLCSLIAFSVAPGHVSHTGIPPVVQFGELDNRRSDRIQRLLDVLRRAQGLQAQIADDINAAIWRKFLFICPWSGVGAASRAPIGVCRGQPGTRRLLQGTMEEILAVAHAHQIALPASVVAETMAALDAVPPLGTASMQRDVMQGRPSELDAQCGAVVRLGDAAGVDTPLNDLLYDILLPQELRAREQLEF